MWVRRKGFSLKRFLHCMLLDLVGRPLINVQFYRSQLIEANKDGLTDILLTRDGYAYLFLNNGNGFAEKVVPGFRKIDKSANGPSVLDLAGSDDTEATFVRLTTGVFHSRNRLLRIRNRLNKNRSWKN